MLSKDQILNRKVRYEVIDVPDLGKVGLRVMSISDVVAFRNLASTKDITIDKLCADLLCRTLCDDKGKRLFGDDDAVNIANELPEDVVTPLFHAAIKVNRLGKDDTAEQAKKN